MSVMVERERRMSEAMKGRAGDLDRSGTVDGVLKRFKMESVAKPVFETSLNGLRIGRERAAAPFSRSTGPRLPRPQPRTVRPSRGTRCRVMPVSRSVSRICSTLPAT